MRHPHLAPDLMAWIEFCRHEAHCYFRKQPETSEIEQAGMP